MSASIQTPLERSGSSSPALADLRLLRGVERPFSEGVALWVKCLPGLCVSLALPVGGAMGLLVTLGWDAAQRLARMTDTSTVSRDLAVVALLYVAALAVSALSVASAGARLSSMHVQESAAGSMGEALKGFVHWLVTILMVSAVVTLASVVFVVPGIVIAMRLFWADEFALMERAGPLRAMARSWDLTRNATGRVFMFQLLNGLLYGVIWLPLVLIVMAAGLPQALASIESPAAAALCVALAGVLVYALFHAVEIAFFYGLRAARQQFATQDSLPRDWIARAVRAPRSRPFEAPMVTGADAANVSLAAVVALPLALALHLALPQWVLSQGGALDGASLARALGLHLALWVAIPLFFTLAVLSVSTVWLDQWGSGLRVVVGILVLLLPLSAFALQSDFDLARTPQSAEAARASVLEQLGAACRAECEGETGDASACQRTCSCMVRKCRALAPDELGDLWRNFASPRTVDYFQRTMRECR